MYVAWYSFFVPVMSRRWMIDFWLTYWLMGMISRGYPLYPFTVLEIGEECIPSWFRWCVSDKSAHGVRFLSDDELFCYIKKTFKQIICYSTMYKKVLFLTIINSILDLNIYNTDSYMLLFFLDINIFNYFFHCHDFYNAKKRIIEGRLNFKKLTFGYCWSIFSKTWLK